LQLRTKFLCSFVLITAALTCATLLIVRHNVQVHLQKDIEQDAGSAIRTFDVIQQQQERELSHTADLLATLAEIRNEDTSVIQDSSEDPWQSDSCNLFALADPSGKIVALHTATPGFPLDDAEKMFRLSLEAHTPSHWWYGGGRLFQVVLQPVFNRDLPRKTRAGTVIVGHEVDASAARELRATSASHLVFRYGPDVAVSTLSPLQEQQFAQEIQQKEGQHPVRLDDELFLAKTVDLTPGQTPAVTLTVLKSMSEAAAFLNRLNHLLLGLGFLAVLAGAGLVYLICDAFTRPLARLAQGVWALEQGDFSYPLDANGGDEVAQVTGAFDRMRCTLQRNEANRERLEGQLRQAQRMEAMGRLAGGVAHDFNNLLTVIKGHSGLLLERLRKGDPLGENTQQIAKAADRAASLTRQLLAFSRMQVLQPKVLDLNALVTDMGKLMTRLIREDIVFTFRAGESLGRVKADPSQIEQVVLNLVVNACDAMPRGGNLTVETRNAMVDEELAQKRPPMPPGKYVVLSVTDTGEGMDASTRARIFEPFFTTKDLGKGTGLGLATVYGVVKQSEGFIWVDTEPGKGARFEVFLPYVSAPTETPRPDESGTERVHARKTVLVAEDEGGIRELICEFLKTAGYTVLAAENGAKALALANQTNGPIDALLTDVVMPNMRGPELAERLRRVRPEAKVVYVSGYLEYERGNGEFLADGFFLQKPFSRDSLIAKMSEALSQEAAAPARARQPV
jgi:signal transduction histidine kinase/ActR/RegA family two-component response regulator